MIHRILAFCRTLLSWAGVLMVLGVCYQLMILVVFQPTQICTITELLASEGFEESGVQSAINHRRVRRAVFGLHHDDGIMLRSTGTKDDVPFLLDVDPNEDLSFCSSGHRDSALECITNQSPGTTLAEWKAWWQDHSHQTQAQWIMEGFKAQGIEFSLPPDHATSLRFLKMLGRDRKEWRPRHEEDPKKRTLPSFVITNIARVLRHHGFDGSTVTKEDIAADPSGEVLDGLKVLMSNRVANAFLSNPFESGAADRERNYLAGTLHPMALWIHTLIAFVLFQSGFFLWLQARFRQRMPPTAITP